MQERLKNYALVICLFVFLLVCIGNHLHVSPGTAFMCTLSGAPLVIVAFSRRRNAQYRDTARREEPASRIVPLRERP
jgi:Flp pilus assembly protein TadB